MLQEPPAQANFAFFHPANGNADPSEARCLQRRIQGAVPLISERRGSPTAPVSCPLNHGSVLDNEIEICSSKMTSK
ncbi:hypothetical protein ROHU_023681 [Labeo rohita]|uniref:Uncharacterized protein n=1 Tax=Labeo rohita TaxID=84645 RepID=A0A498MS29_LABRO|nr:hypothetical protein ROHU_023681 [Labeo rohita]